MSSKKQETASLPFSSKQLTESVVSETRDEATINAVEAASLRKMNEALSEIPHNQKSALVHVQRIQPDQVNDAHLLGFLQAEDYDAKVS